MRSRGAVFPARAAGGLPAEAVRCPVAGALGGCVRPRRRGWVGSPYQAGANTALPAVGCAVLAPVGSIRAVRWPLRRLGRRADPADQGEAELPRRALVQASAPCQPGAGLVGDAGGGGAARLTVGGPRGGARVARHVTARRHGLPVSTGRGPISGERVHP